MDVNRYFCTALLIATAGFFAASASAAESVALNVSPDRGIWNIFMNTEPRLVVFILP